MLPAAILIAPSVLIIVKKKGRSPEIPHDRDGSTLLFYPGRRQVATLLRTVLPGRIVITQHALPALEHTVVFWFAEAESHTRG